MKNLNKAPSTPVISKANEMGELIAEPVLGVVPSDMMSLIENVTHDKKGKVIKVTIKDINKTEALINVTSQTLISQYMAYYWQHGFTGLTKAHQAVKEQAWKDFPLDEKNPDHHVGGDINAEMLKPSQIKGVKARLRLAGRALQAMNFKKLSAPSKPKPKTVEADDTAAIALQCSNIRKFAEAYATPDHGVTKKQLTAGVEFLAALVTIAEKFAEQINPAIEEKEIEGRKAKVHRCLG